MTANGWRQNHTWQEKQATSKRNFWLNKSYILDYVLSTQKKNFPRFFSFNFFFFLRSLTLPKIMIIGMFVSFHTFINVFIKGTTAFNKKIIEFSFAPGFLSKKLLCGGMVNKEKNMIWKIFRVFLLLFFPTS